MAVESGRVRLRQGGIRVGCWGLMSMGEKARRDIALYMYNPSIPKAHGVLLCSTAALVAHIRNWSGVDVTTRHYWPGALAPSDMERSRLVSTPFPGSIVTLL